MDTGQLKRYYLGGLTKDEEIQLESQCFEDDRLFAELMGVQTDLVDAYVRNRLPPHEREAFRRHYLVTPGGREKVRLARILIEATAEVDQNTRTSSSPVSPTDGRWPGWLAALTLPPMPRWVSVAAWVVVMTSSIVLLVDDRRLRLRIEDLASQHVALTEREQRAGQALEAERNRANRPGEQLQRIRDGGIVALSLTPGMTRANVAPPELRIERDTSFVLLELQLETQEALGGYRVVLETADGREVWRQEFGGLEPANPRAEVAIGLAASIFEGGDYIVRLQRRLSPGDFETLSTYQLRAVRGS